jgi:hypothetical protein
MLYVLLSNPPDLKLRKLRLHEVEWLSYDQGSRGGTLGFRAISGHEADSAQLILQRLNIFWQSLTQGLHAGNKYKNNPEKDIDIWQSLLTITLHCFCQGDKNTLSWVTKGEVKSCWMRDCHNPNNCSEGTPLTSKTGAWRTLNTSLNSQEQVRGEI